MPCVSISKEFVDVDEGCFDCDIRLRQLVSHWCYVTLADIEFIGLDHYREPNARGGKSELRVAFLNNGTYGGAEDTQKELEKLRTALGVLCPGCVIDTVLLETNYELSVTPSLDEGEDE